MNSQTFYKITNINENHHGFQYHDGLNVLTEPFSQYGTCVSGGLYFTDINNICNFLGYGVYLREVILPTEDQDFKIVKDGDNQWRANKIIFGKRRDLWTVDTFAYLIDNGLDIAHN